MNFIFKLFIGIVLLIMLVGLWYTIIQNEKLQEKNKQLCSLANQMVDTINTESSYINKYCGSDTLPLPNVSYVECEQ